MSRFVHFSYRLNQTKWLEFYWEKKWKNSVNSDCVNNKNLKWWNKEFIYHKFLTHHRWKKKNQNNGFETVNGEYENNQKMILWLRHYQKSWKIKLMNRNRMYLQPKNTYSQVPSKAYLNNYFRESFIKLVVPDGLPKYAVPQRGIKFGHKFCPFFTFTYQNWKKCRNKVLVSVGKKSMTLI